MNLMTKYLGLTLPHPIVASASPLARTAEGVHELEQAGAAAVVLPSLFAEQIDAENAAGQVPPWLTMRTAELLFPGWSRVPLGAQEYLDLISLSKRITSLPIIASLNADGPGDWTKFARLLTDAGANAIEVNLYYVAADAETTSVEVEQRYIDAVGAVRSETQLPLAVKIGPNFSALANFAGKLVDAGADALVLFNRYYEPDFDPETRDSARRDIVLSQSRHDLRQPLRWTATLSTALGSDVQFAVTGGVHTGLDAVKALMAGATVVEVASELLAQGATRLTGIHAELASWLVMHGYDSVDEIRGVMGRKRNDFLTAAQRERAGYVDTVRSHQN